MLVFVFGSTMFASSTVLAVFMGGLAIGAFFAGRFADRMKRPFLWYGILEGIIGVWALVTPFLFDAAIPIYRIIWQQFHLSVIPFSLTRFAIAALILLPPTTCMGATLPLLSRFVTSSLATIGDRVGTLYSINTLGAVIGSIGAGFFLLPNIGLERTTIVAIITNLILLGIVLAASRKHESGSPLELLPPLNGTQGAVKAHMPPQVVAAIAAFAVSGAVAMTYEVAWTRTLLMVIGSSTYAFTTMLSTFLIGIFVGSLLCSRVVDRTAQPLRWFALAQVLLCIGGLISVHLFNYVPYWNIAINGNFHNDSSGSAIARFLLSGSVLLPITLLLGAIFPLVVKTCAHSLEEVGKSIGTIYSANTLGAIIGAFLAGFVVIPMFGAENSLLYASLINLLIGASLLYFTDIYQRTKLIAIGGALLICAVFAFTHSGIWDPILLLSAQGQRRLQTSSGGRYELPPFEEWRQKMHAENKLAFWKDGACATVGVLYIPVVKTTSLLTNGHVDATDTTDMTNQVMLSGYPLVCRPEARNIAVVGWGSGVTSGTALAYPPVQKTVTIEIEPAVLDAAHKFDHVNLRPDLSPKSVIEINDARNYLLATPEKFDVIISEPSNPWQAGVCNLFTKQYFKIAHDRLTDKGVFCTWLQFQEVAPIDVLHVIAAMQMEFKYVLPMLSNGCLMVLAADSPIHFSPEKANSVIASSPALKQQLACIGITSVVDVLSSIVCSSDMVPQMVAGVAPNTDDRNYLEFDVGKTYENRFFQRENEDMLNAKPGSPWTAVDWDGMDSARRAKLMNEVAEAALRQGDIERSRVWAQESFMTQPNAPSLVTAGLIGMINNAPRVAQSAFAQAERLDPSAVDLHLRRGTQFLRGGDIMAARADLEAAAKLNAADPETRYLLAKTYTEVGRDIVITAQPNKTPENPKKVLELLGNLPAQQDFSARHPDVLLMAAIANMRTSNQRLAEAQVSQYIRMSPQTVIGWRTLGTLLFNRGERIGAAEAWRRGLAVGQSKAAQEVAQATKFAQQGKPEEALTLLTHAVEYDPANQGGLNLLRALAARGNMRAANLLHELGN